MNCTMSISPLNLSPYNSIWTWLIPFISTDLFSYLGAGYQLPKVQAESLVLIDSKVKLDPFTFRVHVDEPSLTFKVKLINSNVTWKLIFFPANFIETFLCTFSCRYVLKDFLYTIAVSLKVILLFVCAA